MQGKSFKLEILYSQLGIFGKSIENPFNDWTDIHVQQGFSWRPESVCFGSLLNDGQCKVNVNLQSDVRVLNYSIRAIVIPFEVMHDGIEVASIIEGVIINVPKGKYELVFNVIPKTCDNELDTYDIAFVSGASSTAKILLEDDLLAPPSILLMEAEPAI